MRKTLKGLFFVFAVFAVLLSYNFAYSDDEVKTVDATGYAPISGGNDAIARDTAIDDARRKAVEQSVGSMVSSETLVENYQTLQDSVYTKTQGYIKSYSVKNESHTNELYQVTITAVVAVGTIKNDLDAIGLLHAKVEKPRVLFMIAEQAIGHKYYTFWWYGKSEFHGETVDMSAAELTLKESFLAKGFNVVDISGSQDTIEISNAFKVADLTDAGARQIGKKLNAEIVIKGKALAKEGPRTEGSSVGSYLADVTAQAIKIDTGTVIASGKGHGVSRHVSDVTGGTEALSRAATELGEKMMEQILAKWSSGSGNIIIKLTGVKDYKKIANFKNTLKKRIRGVSAVFQRKFEGGEAVFELETKVSATNVADDLARIPGFTINNTTAHTVEASMEQ